MNAKIDIKAFNVFKRNAKKDVDYIIASDGVNAYTLEWMEGVYAFQKCGEGVGTFAFCLHNKDLANISKGVKDDIKFEIDNNLEYKANGYKYLTNGGNLARFKELLSLREDNLIYKGKFIMPLKERIEGFVGKNEPKISLNFICWNLKNGFIYACDTKAMVKDKFITLLNAKYEWILYPLQANKYINQQEDVEIYACGDYITILQGNVKIVISVKERDIPPAFEKIIPYSRKVRGSMVIKKDYLLNLLKGFRNETARITINEDGFVGLKDYDRFTKDGVDIPVDRDFIIHNAPLQEGNDEVNLNVKHLTALCRYATNDFISVDIPDRVADGKGGFYNTFSNECMVAHPGGEALALLMRQVV